MINLKVDTKDTKLTPFWSEKSKQWHKQLGMPGITNITSNLRLHAKHVAQLADSDNLREELQEKLITKKVRIYPENEGKYFQALHTHRRGYNLAVDAFNNGEKPSYELCKRICEQVKGEDYEVYDVNLIQSAYDKATKTRAAVIKKRKQGRKAKLHFMSWKHSRRYFILHKLGETKGIYPKQLEEVTYTEKVPEEAVGRYRMPVVYENGEWYICLQKRIILPPVKRRRDKVVALDPGVITFITAFDGESQVVKYGDKFFKRIYGLLLRVDKLIGRCDRIHNRVKKDDGVMSQWMSDQLRYCYKEIDRLKARVKHLVDDLHRRAAYELVSKYGTILLPHFNVGKMVLKKARRIARLSVRQMLSLRHYDFKQHLQWMCEKYGKSLVLVNEAYTSKTYAGKTINDLKSKRSFKIRKSGRSYTIDRDVNGARNILIRFLTKFAV